MNPRMIVVAHERPAMVHQLVTVLTAAGYKAAGALTFRDAIDVIADCRPGTLLVNLELGAFNGLHLAVRCASDFPWMKIVVMGPANPALEEEARRLGVSEYVARSAGADSLVERALDAVAAALPELTAPIAITRA